MIRPTPAIVSQAAARRLPRLVLWALVLAYVLPGLLGREPWRSADLNAFGVMLDMARAFPGVGAASGGSGNWLEPQVLGQAADVQAWLPYWLGAGAIGLMHGWLGWLPADLAARLPFAGLLGLTLLCTWQAAYQLARLPAALPVAFAFGGEARPRDYARAVADAALLALIGCLGLAQLAHEATPDLAQLACSALLLYACARLAVGSAAAQRQGADGAEGIASAATDWTEPATPRWMPRGTIAWWLGAVGLALSGAPWLGAVLGLGWLAWTARSPAQAVGSRTWLVAASGTLLAMLLAWELELPRRVEVWAELWAWLEWESWRRFGRLLLWFTWPVWPLALWTLWRWRRQWHSAHLALPLWFALAALGSSWLLGALDRALLMALPGLACLAAFALPTLSRSVSALIDWFALLFFSFGALVIWVVWLALQTGVPAKPAANVAKLLPGFEHGFSLLLFVPALLATLAWFGVVAWRVGRHPSALWKGLVLSASGGALCWLLLMTLWLPLLNHGMGMAQMAERVRAQLAPGNCALVHGLNTTQITGLAYHMRLPLQRAVRGEPPACRTLLVAPSGFDTLRNTVDLEDWQLRTAVQRLKDSRDSVLVYHRRTASP